MATAITLISSQILGSNTASVTFSSIPSTYRDLRVVIQAFGSASPITTNAQVNGDTASNYSNIEMAGTGTNPQSASITTTAFNSQYTYLDTTLGSQFIWEFLDYSATDKHKLVIRRNGNGVSNTSATLHTGRWANTSSITSITFNASNFATGSRFYLYGIAG